MKTVVGVFEDMPRAREVLEDLLSSGFDRGSISLVANDPEGKYAGELDHNENAGNKGEAAAAAAKGAAAGGIGGLLVSLAIFAIPGVGPVLAAGPLLGLLTGVATTAGVGGVVGALVGGGVLDAETGMYAEAVRLGNVLVGADVDESRVQEVVALMNRHQPIDIASKAEEWRGRGWGGDGLNVESTP